MAVDMFLKIEGADSGVVKGESDDKAKKDHIDVLAWSWGLSQSGNMHFGGGGGSGKANFQDLSITAWYENSTNTLMKMCATGEHLKEVVLTVRKAGTKQLEYIIMTMKEAIITSVSTGGSGGEDKLTVNFSINFAEFEIKYTPQDAKGTLGTPVNFGYDIKANEKTAG